ncbi:MAG: archaetidylserine decarboxylase, partial [Pseudomonadota bacterium]
MSFSRFFANIQSFLPQKLLTNIVKKITRIKTPLIKNKLIKIFIKIYNVELTDALEKDISTYENFNAFFTRKLTADSRPIDEDHNIIVSPVDATIYHYGKINQDQLLQAKGKHYSITALLNDDENKARPFYQGQAITFYLAPEDYHRYHMPCDGQLLDMVYVPGKLFSVNTHSVNKVNQLFCVNERVICYFQTQFGIMAMVLIGAFLVGSMHVNWLG